MQTERKVDWETIKGCFVELHRISRPFLGRALLIGGAACWFYRNQLQKAGDADFKVPLLSKETESQWLSRDIDFTGIISFEALEMLPHQIVKDQNGREHVEVNGIRFGFAQVGLTIDPQEALLNARIASFKHGNETIEFLVADPITLYLEKQALSKRRGSKNDFLHFSLLHDYVAYETVNFVEQTLRPEGLKVSELKRANSFLLSVKSRIPEVLSDPRVQKRLFQRLDPHNTMHRPILDLLSK